MNKIPKRTADKGFYHRNSSFGSVYNLHRNHFKISRIRNSLFKQ